MEEFVLIVFPVIAAIVHLDLKVLIVKQVGVDISLDSLFFVSPLLFAFLVISYLSPFLSPKSRTSILFCWYLQRYYHLIMNAARTFVRMEVLVLIQFKVINATVLLDLKVPIVK